ncbi:MAG: MATE family efflux transporter, partial [Peptostreptococcaceae bacterium]
MKKKVDLVNGNIFKSLLALSIPILGTSFIQMAYNMIDMIWIGRVGSAAVAAVGTAGFFTWFGSGIILISKVGAEIGVSQAIGKDDPVERKKFVYNALLINVITAVVYTVLLIVFRNQLIGFFNLGDTSIINMSIDYLVIVSIGMIFYFINPLLTGIFNAEGNSKTPFIINTIGLVFNIVFDPLLIFGAGPIPAMGVAGAAIATVLAQAIVSAIFIYIFIKDGYSFKSKNKKYIDKVYVNKICKLGLPAAIQNGLFSIFGMLIGRIVAQFGPTVIAVQKVGS